MKKRQTKKEAAELVQHAEWFLKLAALKYADMEAGGHPEVIMLSPCKRLFEACKDYKEAIEALKKFDDEED